MPRDAPVWPADRFVDLDRTSPVPLYHQVAAILEGCIRDGTLAPGDRLENEIEVARRLNLSRPTVRRAIQDVVDKGLLVRRRGIGTQVVRSFVTRPVELTSLYDDLDRAHVRQTTRVLEHGVTTSAPAEVTERLGVGDEDPVFHLRRLRCIDGAPMAILDNHLPAEFADITIPELETGGLYRNLSSRGVVLKVANQRIGARGATDDEAHRLGLEPGAPLLTMARTAMDDSGRAVEVGRHCYRPDMYAFESTLVAR